MCTIGRVAYPPGQIKAYLRDLKHSNNYVIGANIELLGIVLNHDIKVMGDCDTTLERAHSCNLPNAGRLRYPLRVGGNSIGLRAVS
jgi:hypothetical protein